MTAKQSKILRDTKYRILPGRARVTTAADGQPGLFDSLHVLHFMHLYTDSTSTVASHYALPQGTRYRARCPSDFSPAPSHHAPRLTKDSSVLLPDSRVNPNGIALRKRGNSIASTVRGCSHQCLLRAAVAVSDSPTRPVLRAGS